MLCVSTTVLKVILTESQTLPGTVTAGTGKENSDTTPIYLMMALHSALSWAVVAVLCALATTTTLEILGN